MLFFLVTILLLFASFLYLTRNTPTLHDRKNGNDSENLPSPSQGSPTHPTALSKPASQASRQHEDSGSETLEKISPERITVAVFCALSYEAVAVEHMLDEEYECSPKAIGPIKYVYSFGRINQHKIVIAQPHQMGTIAAAHCATAVSQQFPNVRFAFMVGIGAGIPDPPKHDIRLGDIAISIPQDTHSGVLQYDFGKYELDGFTLKGCLNKPPPILTSADKWLERAELKKKRSPLQKNLGRINQFPEFSRPDDADTLFDDTFHHVNKGSNCDACEASEDKITVSRTARSGTQPVIHRGLILSGNGVVKSPKERDHLRRYSDAICFEMEVAGIMDEIPCLIVRGICDYADTHKQDGWHYYAAAVAAAYCRTLLCKIDSQAVEETESRLTEGLESLMKIANEVRDAQGVINQSTKYIEQSLDLKELKIVRGAEFNSYENQHDICLPGTRVELLQEIEEWTVSSDAKSIFWLKGMAGTGKSTISRTIASHLEEKGSLGATFFFKRGEGDRSSGKRLFPTLVAQLVQYMPQTRPFIQQALKDDPHISEKVLHEQFKKLLLEPVLQVDRELVAKTTKVIVIDALDEDEQDDISVILQLLPQVKESKLFQIRFLLTSRPELQIRLGFQRITNDHQDFVLHEIPPSIIKRDISLFLQYKVVELRKTLADRGHKLPLDWPGDQCMAALITMSIPLFIFAATVCRILEDSQWHPEDSLQEILSHQNDTSHLDGTYLPVLNRLLINQSGKRKTKLIDEYRVLIGTILILEAPLPVGSLSKVAGIPKDLISMRLNSLHTVLSIPGDETKPIRLFHLSFRDFLVDLDTRDKTPLWIDEEEANGTITNRCLEVMNSRLRKNICKLPSDGTLKDEIDLRSVDQHLLPELRYACRYWSHHLIRGKSPVDALEEAFLLLKTHFLHWVEAMSILGLASETLEAISRVESHFQNTARHEIQEFLHDGIRFLLANLQMMETAPLQLYSAGLMFSPRNSVTRRMFQESHLSEWKQLPVVEEEWGAELQTLEGDTSPIESVAFSPDSRVLVSGSSSGTMRIWDAHTGQLRRAFNTERAKSYCIAFSPDGQLLACTFFLGNIKLWDPSTGSLRQALTSSYRVRSVAFSPDGQLLASGSSSKDGIIQIWNPNKGDLLLTFKGHDSQVESLAFSPDGQLLASGSPDCSIKLWDPQTGTLCQIIGALDSVKSVAFSPDGQLLASGSDSGSEGDTIKLWNPKTGNLHLNFTGHDSSVHCLAFSPDGQLLASGDSKGSTKLWNHETASLCLATRAAGHALCVAFSPDGRLFASGSFDGSVKILNPSKLKMHHDLEKHSEEVNCVAFSPNGGLVASGSSDHTIKLWDSDTGKLRQTIDGHSSWINSLAFSPDGQSLASSSGSDFDMSIKIWNPKTGDLRQTCKGHSEMVTDVTFSPDVELLVSSSNDHSIRFWNPSTGDLYRISMGHSDSVRSVRFSPDGRLLASGSTDGTIKLCQWDHTTRNLSQIYYTQDAQWIESVDFSPDSRLLACFSEVPDNKYVTIMDSHTGEVRRNLRGHSWPAWLEKNEIVSMQDERWVCLDGQRFLWLPKNYRIYCLASKGSLLALGHVDGRISVLSMEHLTSAFK